MVRREEQIGAKCGIKRGFQLEQSEKIPDPFVCLSGSVPGLGLIVKKPEGEPVVPSIIFSAFKVN